LDSDNETPEAPQDPLPEVEGDKIVLKSGSNTVTWTVMHEPLAVDDPPFKLHGGDNVAQFKWRASAVNVDHEGSRPPIDYFRLCYPEQKNKEFADSTNACLKHAKLKELENGEWLQFLGIRLAMAVESRRGPLKDYWLKEVPNESVCTPGNFLERFKMTHNRFCEIQSHFRFMQKSSTNNVRYLFQ